MVGVLADVRAPVPAALALFVPRRGDLDAQVVGVGMHGGARDDQHETQVIAQAGQDVVVGRVGVQVHFGLQRRADGAGRTHLFQLALHLRADGAQARPLGGQGLAVGKWRQRVIDLGEDGDARGVGLLGQRRAGQDLPGFLGGEREDGRHQLEQRLGDVEQRGLRRTARGAAGSRRVQAVFQDVQVERAEVFRAERLQAGDGGMEIVAFVVALDFGLHLRGHRQRVAVDFEQLAIRHGLADRVEVGHVGQQEAQRVADAAIAFDHALEDLVGDRQLARVVGGGDPQAQDLGAERIGHFLRRDDVADRLAHLAALAVDHEAVREQALVGGWPYSMQPVSSDEWNQPRCWSEPSR